MIATFVVEMGLAVWTLWRFRQSLIVWLTVILLLCLATFQLAEYNICEGALRMSGLTWARIGYVAITALPAIGIHMLTLIARKRMPVAVYGSYLAMLGFMAYFLFVGHGITATSCGGNYVIFETNNHATSWYTLYYYGLELVTLLLAYHLGRNAKGHIKQALYGLTAAYLTLIVPTATVNLFNRELIHAVPSVMCGFAVFLALIVTLYVLPRTAEVKS